MNSYNIKDHDTDNDIFPQDLDKFINIASLYVSSKILSIFDILGITDILKSNYVSAYHILNELNLASYSYVALSWMLEFLCHQGYVTRTCEEREANCYKLKKNPPLLDRNEIEESFSCLKNNYKPSHLILKQVAQGYPDFFKGKIHTGVKILIFSDKMKLWQDYFSEGNDGYDFFNNLGSYGCVQWFPRKQPLTVLELGSGIGGASLSLIKRLQHTFPLENIKKIVLSDISTHFLKSVKKTITEEYNNAYLPPLSFQQVNINESFAKQDIRDNSFDIVYGVNVLHVANDLPFSLQEVYGLLKKDGKIILSECVRADDSEPVIIEFIFNILESYFNVQTIPSLRPTVGFLSPQRWKSLLKNAGFTKVEMFLNTDERFKCTINKPTAMVIKGEKRE